MEKKIILKKKIRLYHVHSPLPWIQTFEVKHLVQQTSLIFEKFVPLGCSTSRITFKAFSVFEGWWWLSDRRADISISCRSRTGQSRLLTSLGNERSFRRQPRFQQDELQSLVTRWKGLLRAAVTSRILGQHLKWKALVLASRQPLVAPSARVQKYKLRGREQFSGLWGIRRASCLLDHLWSFRKEKTLWWLLEISRHFGSNLWR